MQANDDDNQSNNQSNDDGRPAPSVVRVVSSNDDHRVLFPQMLHRLLCESEARGTAHLVSWLGCGRIFKVHHRDGFVKQVLPAYFRQTRYKSFVRQLNLWGYTCVISGPNKGSYCHDRFIRGNPNLCFEMQRVKIKGIATATVTATKKDRSNPPSHRVTRARASETDAVPVYKAYTSTPEAHPEPSRMVLREGKEEPNVLEIDEGVPNPISLVQSKTSAQAENSTDRDCTAAFNYPPTSSAHSIEFPSGGPSEERDEPNSVSIEDCFFVFDELDMSLDFGIFD